MEINKRVIAGIPCKNEEWIIKKLLKALSTFCFKIIIVDDGSTDKTEQISKSFPKVEFHKRIRDDVNHREDGKQRQQIINYMIPHNPDYCLFLDADEIPSPDFVGFMNTINPTINLWRLPWFHLWKDENHYRVDSYKTGTGANIIWDPMNGGQRKGFLMKFNKNIKYEYELNRACSISMEPKNVPLPHSTTVKTRIIHWGKIGNYFKSGEKDKHYAEMRCYANKNLNLNQRINHHKECRSESTLKLKQIENNWHWD